MRSENWHRPLFQVVEAQLCSGRNLKALGMAAVGILVSKHLSVHPSRLGSIETSKRREDQDLMHLEAQAWQAGPQYFIGSSFKFNQLKTSPAIRVVVMEAAELSVFAAHVLTDEI